MAKSIELKFAFYMCWLLGMLCCSAVVYAAENDKFATGIGSIPYESYKYTLIISGVAGILATLAKMTKNPPTPVRNLHLEIIKDTLGSIVAGALAFLCVTWVDMSITPVNFVAQAIIIFFAGFGGIKIIEWAYNDGFLVGLKEALLRLFNRQTPPPPSGQ